MARYVICEGWDPSRCAFYATVVDTDKPLISGGEHYKDGSGRLCYESVCECFNMADAELVCKALNALSTITA